MRRNWTVENCFQFAYELRKRLCFLLYYLRFVATDPVRLNGDDIAFTHEHKITGFIINSKLNFFSHCKTRRENSLRSANIKMVCDTRRGAPIEFVISEFIRYLIDTV